MRILLPLFVLASLLLASCSSRYEVKGSTVLTHLDGRMLYLEVQRGEHWVRFDSASIVHGKFTMKGEMDSVMMGMLYLDNEPIMPLVIEDGKMKVTINHTDLRVKGTDLNDELYAFFDMKDELERELQTLQRRKANLIFEFGDLIEVSKELSRKTKMVQQKMDDCVNGFIRKNYTNVLGPNIFIMTYASNPYPMFTPSVEQLLNDAPQSFMNNAMIKQFILVASRNSKYYKNELPSTVHVEYQASFSAH